MQKQELVEARNSWLELLNSKELAFLTYLINHKGMIQPILALDKDYTSSSEARAMGVTTIHNPLIFQGLIEKNVVGTTVLWRLTERGLKVKKALISMIEALKEVV